MDGFQILIHKVESWWQITPYKLRLCFKLKQNSYIYSTYTLPSRGTNLHATNGRGEMEWSCQKLRRVEKKSTTPYLRSGLLIFMRTVAHVFILLHRKTLYFILSLNLSCTDLRWKHICNKHYILTGILQSVKTCIMPQ